MILFRCTTLVSFFVFVSTIAQAQSSLENSKEIDRYIDLRHRATDANLESLISKITKDKSADLAKLEKELRQPRAEYPALKGLPRQISKHSVKCLHVDYSSSFYLHIPDDIDFEKSVSLVVVGHGGNSSMSKQRAEATARSYINIYARGITKNLNGVIVAPVSERGWGQIGNSLIQSSISKVKRMMPIDPDRIYITGQSMGGHLAYRSALTLPDWWGAVSPHSGGYDFVQKNSIKNLFNVPGYSVWGVREPYGINKDNRTNRDWAKKNSLNWQFVEKNGGHTIYVDELPKIAEFFKKNPRNLYRDQVYIRAGGAMKFVKTWQVKTWPEHRVDHETKPLRWNMRHWLEVTPRPDHKKPLEIFAKKIGKNKFEVVSDQVRNFSIYLHPKMVDFSQPIIVDCNGETIFKGMAKKDPRIMFNLAREFDDRGRIFWAKINLAVKTDKQVEIGELSRN